MPTLPWTEIKNIVVPDNGSIIDITDQGQQINLLKEATSSKVVMVDGLEQQRQVVIRDRQMLAQDGMFIDDCVIDILVKSANRPTLFLVGSLYLKESQDLLSCPNAYQRPHQTPPFKMHPINFDYVWACI